MQNCKNVLQPQKKAYTDMALPKKHKDQFLHAFWCKLIDNRKGILKNVCTHCLGTGFSDNANFKNFKDFNK